MIGRTVLLGLDCILALKPPLTSETKHTASCNNNFWRVTPQTYTGLCYSLWTSHCFSLLATSRKPSLCTFLAKYIFKNPYEK